jgi:DNA-binding SARP family transcriptional activator/pimeloyl-ACP methyl ester carboxylesterase
MRYPGFQDTYGSFLQRPHAGYLLWMPALDECLLPRSARLMKGLIAMGQLSLTLFGAPQVRYDERTISLRFHKELALLMYLAVTQRPHTRLALATLLWPELDQPSALAALRRAIYQIKRDVGEDVLRVTRHMVCLDGSLELHSDTGMFRAAATLCREHDHEPQALFAECVTALETATSAYTDDFLAGFSLPDSSLFDEWMFFEREELRAECLRMLATLTTYYEHHQEWDRAIATARRLLLREPCHEPAHRALMRLYLRLGQHDAAQRQYALCKQLLSEQWGVAPHPETERLHQAMMERSQDHVVRQSTQYAQNGTTYLAYQTIGEGTIDLLIIGGYITHLDQLWEEPDLAGFYEQLSTLARVIVYDKRGVGLSDRVSTPPAMEQQVADARAILEAANSRRVILFAVSDGAALGIHLALRFPQLVAGLVIYGGQAKGVQGADYPWGLTPEQYRRWAEKLVKGWGGPVNLEFFAPSRAHDQRLRHWWAQTQRLAASPGAIQSILEGIRDSDVRPLLSQIRVPTLILHRRDDRCVRIASGRYLDQHIPHARFVELPGEDHWWWVGERQPFYQEIGQFIEQCC